MRFRLIQIFQWTTAIAVVLYFVFYVLAPLMKERHGPLPPMIVLAAIITVGACVWMNKRIKTPQDRLVVRALFWGATIGLFLGAHSGIGNLYFFWQNGVEAEELGSPTGALLGLLVGSIAGVLIALIYFDPSPSAPTESHRRKHSA